MDKQAIIIILLLLLLLAKARCYATGYAGLYRRRTGAEDRLRGLSRRDGRSQVVLIYRIIIIIFIIISDCIAYVIFLIV